MSAQSEFLHVWLLAFMALFVVDVYSLRTQPVDRFAAKWILTAALCLLSYRRVGLLFRLEWGDVAALAAVCALLSPVIVVLFFVLLKVIDAFMRPMLLHAGHGGAYPFMPVATVSTLAAIPIATYLQSQTLLLG